MSTMPASTLPDRTAREDCTLVPGSLQRVREMAGLRVQGWSLGEIATQYAVSRERVRQILSAHGGPDPHDVAEARRRRVEQVAEARIDELLAFWRAGEHPGQIARRLGLQATTCRYAIERFATDVDHAARRVSLTASAGATPTYSERDIIDALTLVAARLGRIPSAKEYAAVAGARKLPSLTTVVNRMGGWSRAVTAAGLGRRAAPARPRARQWTEQSCWDALRQTFDGLGEIPSVLAYERFAAARGGMPSSATIRNRLGRWSMLVARLAAQRELAQQAQIRARTAGDALVGART